MPGVIPLGEHIPGSLHVGEVGERNLGPFCAESKPAFRVGHLTHLSREPFPELAFWFVGLADARR